ncbi:unnamed protein product [Cuscuta europaea]|uniref:Uncharacterized protein n=1 Tax=Cuscuta europaea TaxID=41803 RepID=A0A9P0ZZ88_CUSEU|nr:unnamed protein product [Cuscuta europaea]
MEEDWTPEMEARLDKFELEMKTAMANLAASMTAQMQKCIADSMAAISASTAAKKEQRGRSRSSHRPASNSSQVRTKSSSASRNAQGQLRTSSLSSQSQRSTLTYHSSLQSRTSSSRSQTSSLASHSSPSPTTSSPSSLQTDSTRRSSSPLQSASQRANSQHQRTKESERLAASEGKYDHSHSSMGQDSSRRDIGSGSKIELPWFNGDNVDKWIVKMEEYFLLKSIEDEERPEEKSSGVTQSWTVMEYKSSDHKIAGPNSSELENQVVPEIYKGAELINAVPEGIAIPWQSNLISTTASKKARKEEMGMNKEETEEIEEGNDGKQLQGMIRSDTDATKYCGLYPISESNSSYQVAPKRRLVGHLTILKKSCGSGLTREPAHMLQAEEGAHGQEQKNAVNFYVPCAKDASGEVHWQNLHKSLHRVSSAVNGRYEAFQKIEDAPRATKADNSFLEKLGIIEGSLSEDDGDGYEYIDGGHLWKTYAAKLSSSVSTLIVANTEGLWKRSNRGLLVKLLVGKGDMLESFVNNGEPLQTAMPARMRSQGW